MTQNTIHSRAIWVLWFFCLLSSLLVVITAFYHRKATDEYLDLLDEYNEIRNINHLLLVNHYTALNFIKLGNTALQYNLKPPDKNAIIVVD